MADNQDQNTDQNTNQNSDGTNNQNSQNQNTNTSTLPDVDALVQAKLDEALKDIKGKLDKAYSSRDEALTKIKEFEKKEREAELKRLQDEGKHKEAYEMQLADLNAKLTAEQKRNVELTRDIDVRNALASHPFRNENAVEMAYREVVGQLVQNEQGVWVHKTGISIRDFIKGFAESDDNSFLFKAKASTGSGSNGGKPSDTSGGKKSLFQLSQDEVLKLAKEGKLRG